MMYFAGFQPCDWAALELPFMLVPLVLGIFLLYMSRRSHANLTSNKVSILVAGAVILTLLVPVELFLFHGERFDITSEQATKVNGILWPSLVLLAPLLWLGCRHATKYLQAEQLATIAKRCLFIAGVLFALVGIGFGLASSCYGIG